MINSAENYPLSVLFNPDDSLVYSIPKYQREYKWRKENWESLYDDVFENQEGYFIGSIICINHSKDAIRVRELEIVDGQQRLTTISLLFAAIYDALSNCQGDSNNSRNLVEILNMKSRLVLKTDEKRLRVVPQVQNNNLQDYKSVLTEIKIIEFHETVPYASSRKIFRCFQYFKDRIRDMSLSVEDPVQSILNFLQKLLKASLVKIEVANHSDAFTLFESLNNRGMPLTPVDLIKNKLLAKLDANSESREIDSSFERWNGLLRYLGDDYGTQERFFRQYYNAFRDELYDIAQVPLATRSNLIHVYEKLIERDANGFIKKITDAGRLYGLMVFLNQDDVRFHFLHRHLKDLERIQGTPSYLLILYLLSRKQQLKLEDDHLVDIIHLLVCFFVRRNLTVLFQTFQQEKVVSF